MLKIDANVPCAIFKPCKRNSSGKMSKLFIFYQISILSDKNRYHIFDVDNLHCHKQI